MAYVKHGHHGRAAKYDWSKFDPSLSLRENCRRLGCSPGAVYHHCRSLGLTPPDNSAEPRGVRSDPKGVTA